MAGLKFEGETYARSGLPLAYDALLRASSDLLHHRCQRASQSAVLVQPQDVLGEQRVTKLRLNYPRKFISYSSRNNDA